jgi:hypothetical protein
MAILLGTEESVHEALVGTRGADPELHGEARREAIGQTFRIVRTKLAALLVRALENAEERHAE